MALGSDGTVLATLALGENIDPIDMTYDATNGQLFVLDSNPDQIVEVNTTNGSVVSRIDVTESFPGANAGGITIDSSTGNFWIGGSSGVNVVEIDRTGVVQRFFDANALGITNELTGLDFDANDDLLVSSAFGVIHRVSLPELPPPPPADPQFVFDSEDLVNVADDLLEPSDSGEALQSIDSVLRDQDLWFL